MDLLDLQFYWIQYFLLDLYSLLIPFLKGSEAARLEQFISIYRVPLIFLLDPHNSPINVFIIVINLWFEIIVLEWSDDWSKTKCPPNSSA